MSFNKVILHGNLTRDVELRYTPKGAAVGNFGLAINHRWKTESGEEKEEVTFVDIQCWNKQAEVLAQYLKKGAQLLVEGRLKMNEWTDKQTNQKRSKLYVELTSFSFVGHKDPNASTGAPAAPTPQHSAPAPAPTGAPPAEDDSVPF